jgi:UDP-N-acetyl-D-mannosaminuronic acid dehydrogenase
MKNVCVLGLGYIGLPTAAMFATHGMKVIGVDVNDRITSILNSGEIHIQEQGLRDLFRQALLSENLTIENTCMPADAFIIAVPTPLKPDKTADMHYVISASEMIVPVLQAGNLVVLESTSPPQTTTDLVKPILEKSGLKAGEDFLLAYSPERVLPGKILKELIENARVIGGINTASAEAGKELYSTFVKGEILLTDSTTAEMVKLMENTYRDVNIAIANEFSRLADRFGIDVWEAVQIANLHPRVNILNPGPGVGGHCISIDPWFLVEAAPNITPLISTARRVNDAQPEFVVELVECALGNLTGKKIAVLGLSYKPDVDDLRESPAIKVACLLSQAGAEVHAFEPFKTDANIAGFNLANAIEEALLNAQALLLMVKHSQFQTLDPLEIAAMTPARIAIDTVSGWDAKKWESAGFEVFHLGCKKEKNGQTNAIISG